MSTYYSTINTLESDVANLFSLWLRYSEIRIVENLVFSKYIYLALSTAFDDYDLRQLNYNLL